MRATVLVPTHDHASTLPLAVDSALRQEMTDLEVVIIGDGVTDKVRAAAERLARLDPRVIFMDLPKGPHHGEVHRDAAVRGARSDALFYLCDDDLLLPRHVKNLLALLAEADLVQSRNGWIDTSGELQLYPTDLADSAAIDWHLREPRRNSTSLTGTAHTRGAYLALPTGWETTPHDEWPDHYQWKKFFRMPGFRGATHPEMTALQLPTSNGRESWDERRRLAELSMWRDQLADPNGHDWLQEEVARATARQLNEAAREASDLWYDATRLREENAALARAASDAGHEAARLRHENTALAGAAAAMQLRVSELSDRAAQLEATQSQLLSSRSWRLTAPVRGAVARMHGARSSGPSTETT